MLQSRLLGILRRELESRSFELSPDCQTQIEQMIMNGIVRMRINKAIDRPGHVIQAEHNLKALVRYFCEYAQEQETFPHLESVDFHAALITCPTFWPYCSSE